MQNHYRNTDKFRALFVNDVESLMETAHLLSSPKNARRLISALNRARKNKGQAKTVSDLRLEVGLK